MIFSGIVIPISTIDWYGRSVTVIFFNGCNFKCLYCSNNNFIKIANQRIEPMYMGGSVMEIKEVEKMILDARPFISAVVFSGGEPTTQFDALAHLAAFAKKQGLLVGIETNGYYTDRLLKLVQNNLLDRIFLDVKAPLDDSNKYSFITGGKPDAAERVSKSLEIQNVQIEIRTTVFRNFSYVSEIARSLKGKGNVYVIQQGIPENAPEGEIRKERAFTRNELMDLARTVSSIKNVKIRTKEKGEEKI